GGGEGGRAWWRGALAAILCSVLDRFSHARAPRHRSVPRRAAIARRRGAARAGAHRESVPAPVGRPTSRAARGPRPAAARAAREAHCLLSRRRLPRHPASHDRRPAAVETARRPHPRAARAGDGFPEGVTAFREGMAVHGRYRKPCPVCGSPVQRIRYAANEVNYCATCQTGGRVLADRALSRLLQEDWPRSLEEWEARLPGP